MEGPALEETFMEGGAGSKDALGYLFGPPPFGPVYSVSSPLAGLVPVFGSGQARRRMA